MRIAIWCVFGLLAGSWTAGAWIAAELMQWASQLMASGAAADLGQAAARWPPPMGLGPWVDPAWITALQGMTLWALEAVRDSLPFVGSALGWLVPAVWFVWGLGTVALLGLTGVALWLCRRFTPSFQSRSKLQRAF